MNQDFKLAGLTLTGREYNLESAFDTYALKKSYILWTFLIALGYDEDSVLGMARGIVILWASLRLSDWHMGESGTIAVILECLLDKGKHIEKDANIDRVVLIAVTALFCFDRAVASNSRNRAVAAANWLERADELYYYSSRNHNLTEKHILSERGLNAVLEKLRLDPKQEEKKIVKDCWDAWQSKPHQYANNTKFATAMIDKFRPDDPKEESKHLSSVKKITEWCTDWKRNKACLTGRDST